MAVTTATDRPMTTEEAAPVAKKKGRILFVNVLRAYAMFIVVMIHVASVPGPHYNTISSLDWWITNAIHAFSKGGPPMFTMVSGMLLLNPSREQPLSYFFRRRFIRVLGPFVVWAVIYLGWRVVYGGDVFTIGEALREIIQGPVYYHLWFIQMILGLYLATPILRIYVRNARQRDLAYFLGVWVFAVAILPLISRYLNVNIGIQIVITTSFVGYFVLGYFLKDVVLKPRQILPVLIGIVACMLFTEVATYQLMIQADGALDTFFLDNQSLNIILMASGMFLFLKSLPYDHIFARWPVVKRTFDVLSSASFGIYFVHVLVMELLSSGMLGFRLTALTIHPLVGVPLTTVVTLSISLGITLLLKRIPYVRYIVP